MRGEIDERTALELVNQLEAKAKEKQQTTPELCKTKWLCQSCHINGDDDTPKEASEFGCENNEELYSTVLVHGHWLRCTTCQNIVRKPDRQGIHGILGKYIGIEVKCVWMECKRQGKWH